MRSVSTVNMIGLSSTAQARKRKRQENVRAGNGMSFGDQRETLNTMIQVIADVEMAMMIEEQTLWK